MLSTLKSTLIRSIKMHDIRFRYDEKEKKGEREKRKKKKLEYKIDDEIPIVRAPIFTVFSYKIIES